MEIEYFDPAAVSEAVLNEIAEFRYSIFIDEMGFDDIDADHQYRRLIDRLDKSAFQITARDDGKLVGVGRANILRRQNDAAWAQLFKLNEVDPNYSETSSISSRLMIAPNYRRGALMVEIMINGLRIVNDNGCDWCSALCRPELEKLFVRMGFERYATPVELSDRGTRVLMKYSVSNPQLSGNKIATMIAERAGLCPTQPVLNDLPARKKLAGRRLGRANGRPAPTAKPGARAIV